MSKAQSDAVKARIETLASVNGRTFKSMAPHQFDTPYVLIHPASGSDEQVRFTAGRTAMYPRFTLHIVGETADQVEQITDKLKAKFISNGLGIPVVVAGESCKSLWWDSPVPLQVSTDPQPTIVYQVVELGWTAEPA